MFVNDAQVTKPNLLTTTGVVNAIDQGLVGSLFAYSTDLSDGQTFTAHTGDEITVTFSERQRCVCQ